MTCKQLLPIYDKPMIYYRWRTLMLAGIRDILLITTPTSRGCFKRLSATAATWGLHITLRGAARAEGLAQSFIIGREFIGDARRDPRRQHLPRPVT